MKSLKQWSRAVTDVAENDEAATIQLSLHHSEMTLA